MCERKANGANKEYGMAKALIKNDNDEMIAWGLIIFPDHYDTPSVPVGMPTIKNSVYYGTLDSGHCSDNTLSLADWEMLESVGCVFLPAAWRRDKNSDQPAKGDGFYWTDHSKTETAIAMTFSDTDMSSTTFYGNKVRHGKTVSRKDGLSVRLVRQIN